MARSFPDGSKSTRSFPDPPAPAADTSLWEVVYDADLTAQSDSGSLGTGATVTIEGVDWSSQSGVGTYCASCEINSSGLQIRITDSNSDAEQKGSTDTSPRIEVLVSALLGGSAPAYDDTLAFQVFQTSSGMNDNWLTQGLTVRGASTKWVANRTLYYSSYTSGPIGNDVMKGDNERLSVLETYGTGSSEPGLREIVWHCGSSSFVLGANISGAVVDPLNCTSMEALTTVDSAGGTTNVSAAPTIAITPSAAKLQIIAAHEDSSGGLPSDWTATFTRIRALKRKKGHD